MKCEVAQPEMALAHLGELGQVSPWTKALFPNSSSGMPGAIYNNIATLVSLLTLCNDFMSIAFTDLLGLALL